MQELYYTFKKSQYFELYFELDVFFPVFFLWHID